MEGLATIAVVIALAALLAMVVMGRAANSTRACWAERQAIAAEMQVWATMDDDTVLQKLNVAYSQSASPLRAKQIRTLEKTMPDC